MIGLPFRFCFPEMRDCEIKVESGGKCRQHLYFLISM